MSLTTPQGRLILTNDLSQNVLFNGNAGNLGTTGFNISTGFTLTNLISWWKLEQNTNSSGGIIDSAYSTFAAGANPGNHGTKFGTASVVTGPTNGGNGLTFSGDDYIDVLNSSLIYTTEFSIECWVKAITNIDAGGPNFDRFAYEYYNTGPSTLSLIAFRNNTHDILYSYGTTTFSDVTLGGVGYNDSVWNQFVITYNSASATGKLYVNGSLQTTHTSLAAFTAPTAGNGNMAIGSNRPHGAAQSVAADLDEYKFYDKELFGPEVLANYNYYQ